MLISSKLSMFSSISDIPNKLKLWALLEYFISLSIDTFVHGLPINCQLIFLSKVINHVI